jgi:hypothetical protein
MVDLLLILLVILFFVAADLLVRGCRRIVDRRVGDRTEEQR